MKYSGICACIRIALQWVLAAEPNQSSPPIFGIVFLRTLPQHRHSRFSGSVSRLTSFGVLTRT